MSCRGETWRADELQRGDLEGRRAVEGVLSSSGLAPPNSYTPCASAAFDCRRVWQSPLHLLDIIPCFLTLGIEEVALGPISLCFIPWQKLAACFP